MYVDLEKQHVSLCVWTILLNVKLETFRFKQVKREFCICTIQTIKRSGWLPPFLTSHVKSCITPTFQASKVLYLLLLLPPQENNTVTSKSRLSESEDQSPNSDLKVQFATHFMLVSQLKKKKRERERVIWLSSASVFKYGKRSVFGRNGEHENL